LADPERILEHVESLKRQKKDLEGEVILITAGPTQEPLDPVRFVSNRSSGKMGYALAETAARRGARVILVSGPVNIPVPANVESISVRTALEVRKAVMDHLEESTTIVKNAAAADYYAATVSRHKLKKMPTRHSRELDPTPDILAEVGQRKGDRLLIGFAAETQNLIEEARRKMAAKNCDMLVGNLVNQNGLGFESDQNEIEIVTRSGKTIHAGPADKRDIAERIWDEVGTLRLALRDGDRPA